MLSEMKDDCYDYMHTLLPSLYAVSVGHCARARLQLVQVCTDVAL